MKKIGLLCGVVLLSAVICVAASPPMRDGRQPITICGISSVESAHWSPGYPAIDELSLRFVPNSDSYPRQSRSRS